MAVLDSLELVEVLAMAHVASIESTSHPTGPATAATARAQFLTLQLPPIILKIIPEYLAPAHVHLLCRKPYKHLNTRANTMRQSSTDDSAFLEALRQKASH